MSDKMTRDGNKTYTQGIAGQYSARNSALTAKERVVRASSYYSGGGGNFTSSMSWGPNYFSATMPVDFLELPQSLREKREVYRHYYKHDPIVGQAIDLHTELPLSKLRLSTPKPKTCPPEFESPEDYGKYILWFFDKMVKRTKLFQRLLTGVHHYWLDGTTYIFAEDSHVDVPATITTGSAEEGAYYQKHYIGWKKINILPIDQVEMVKYSFCDEPVLHLIPSAQDRAVLSKAQAGDREAQVIADQIPGDLQPYFETGGNIPLGTDPDEGSFCYTLAARKLADEALGTSLLDRVLRTLTYREKLRQAQTQIASRSMTPRRIVYAEGISLEDLDFLQEQVDLAVNTPDHSIVTNFEVHWDEQSSRDRLLDLSSEYEVTDKQLFAGLGVTEAMINGEALMSGDRIKLEIINTRYALLRELLQEYVEEYLFRPVARRKGFVEKNKWGEDVEIFPRLSFSRISLKDSQDTYDALFNLYQKGSVPISVILELFNLDAGDIKEQIESDMFTVNDATFNEVLRTIYGEAGRSIVEKTDVSDRLAAYMKLQSAPAAPEEAEDSSSRFGRAARRSYVG